MGNITWHENQLWLSPELLVSQNLRIKNLLCPDSQKNHFVQLDFFSSSNYENVIFTSSIKNSEVLLPWYCHYDPYSNPPILETAKLEL